MKAHEKKKLWRRQMREQVKAGKIPAADGRWDNYDAGKTSHSHMFNGYHLNK